MYIPKEMKANIVALTRCVSKDVHRKNITLVSYDAKAGTLTATDGHRFATVFIGKNDEDISALIEIKTLKDAIGYNVQVKEDACVFPNGATVPHKKDVGDYPDIARVTPAKEVNTLAVGINISLLADAAKAISTHHTKGAVTLRINPEDNAAPIIIEDSNGNNLGVIMPMRI